jgi:hypothetical protein
MHTDLCMANVLLTLSPLSKSNTERKISHFHSYAESRPKLIIIWCNHKERTVWEPEGGVDIIEVHYIYLYSVMKPTKNFKKWGRKNKGG